MRRPRHRHGAGVRAAVAACLATVALAAGATPAAEAHPIHTTLAQVTHDSASRAIVVSLRVFADDFGVAVGRHSGVRAGPDHAVEATAAHRYVRSTFTLNDGSGRSIPLEWCGAKRTGEVVWLCLRAHAPRAPRGLRVLSSLLFEVHSDQVNLVQSTIAGKKASMLFTRGDQARALP